MVWIPQNDCITQSSKDLGTRCLLTGHLLGGALCHVFECTWPQGAVLYLSKYAERNAKEVVSSYIVGRNSAF